MSYLDDPRVFFAAERTMLAWQRTAIALIGLGFVIERFGLFVRMIAANVRPAAPGGVSVAFGVTFLMIGAAVAIVSAIQFRRFVNELSSPEIPRGGYAVWLGPLVNLMLAGIAFALVAWFVSTG